MSKFCEIFRLRLRKICLAVKPAHNLNIHTHPHCNTSVFFFSCCLSAKGEVQSKKSWMLSSAQIPSTPTNETPVRPEYLTPMTFMGDKGVSFGVNGEYIACLMGQKLRVYSFKDQTVQRSVLYQLGLGAIASPSPFLPFVPPPPKKKEAIYNWLSASRRKPHPIWFSCSPREILIFVRYVISPFHPSFVDTSI